jgi:glycosyltransferase involved in cell wall biosynthesis
MSWLAPREDTLVSVVAPARDEDGSIGLLIEGVRAALAGVPAWELIVVDDGSQDDTACIVADAGVADSRVRLVRLARNYGQSLALQAGFDHARGAVVVSIDGDLQNDPADIPLLLEKLEEGFDLVVGRRIDRHDSWIARRVPSWLANLLLRRLTGIPIHDVGCTLKAYRRKVLDEIELYADQHRFVPVLAAASSAARIAEVPVSHRPRRFGQSKYGLERVPIVLADLLVVKMILTFHDRPLALFGSGAFVALVLAGSFALATIGGFLVPPAEYSSAVVFPGMALLFLALSSHLLLLGVLGEVLVRQWMPEGGRQRENLEVAP